MGRGYLTCTPVAQSLLCLLGLQLGGLGGGTPGTGQTSSRKADGEREGQGTLSTPAGPRGSGTAHLFRVEQKKAGDTTLLVCRGGGTAPGTGPSRGDRQRAVSDHPAISMHATCNCWLILPRRLQPGAGG